MRNAVKGAIVAATVAGTLALTGGAANAGAWATYNTRDGGVGLRSGPSQSYSLLGRGYADQHAYINYFVTGQTIYGDNRWGYDDHYLADWTYWGTVYSARAYLLY